MEYFEIKIEKIEKKVENSRKPSRWMARRGVLRGKDILRVDMRSAPTGWAAFDGSLRTSTPTGFMTFLGKDHRGRFCAAAGDRPTSYVFLECAAVKE